MTATSNPVHRSSTYLGLLLVLGLTHLLNDLIQTLIPAVYPILSKAYALDFAQIGMITLTFQIAGSLFQPLVGLYTDRHPLPYSSAVGSVFTLVGITSLAFAGGYSMILVSVALIGIGSSIYHPEATRMARYAAHARQGLAQGIFQVGGQMGGATAPLAAAFIIVPLGQSSLSWFSLAPIAGVFLALWIATQHDRVKEAFTAASAHARKSVRHVELPSMRVALGLAVLVNRRGIRTPLLG